MLRNIKIYQSILIFLCLCIPICVWSSAPSGTQITNTALLDYKDLGGFQYSAPSNPVSITVGGSPLLTITKIARPNPVSAGKELTYIIQYANVGNVPARDVMITDVLPASVSFLSATGDGKEKQGAVNWNIGNLAVNESGAVELKVKVDDGLKTGNKIENSGSITDSTGAVVKSVLSVVAIGETPNLELRKSANTDIAYPNTDITYTIEYANKGNVPATQVRITDQLPAGTTMVSAAGGGLENRRIVTWTVENLVAGGSGSVQFAVRVGSGLTKGAVIPNIANISSKEGVSALSNQVNVIVHEKMPIPAKITLVPDPDTILGDGKHSSELTATVVDAAGAPLPDGIIVTFTTSKGTFSNGLQETIVPTRGGKAVTHLTADIVSNIPVEAFAKATAGTEETGIVEAAVKIIFAPGAIAGMITSQNRGKAIAGAKVVIMDMSGNVVGSVLTGSDGSYFVFIPQIGDYKVVIETKDESNKDVTVTEVVSVSALFGAVFEPKNSISGTVSDCKTNALKGVVLRLLDTGRNPVLDGKNQITAASDSKGMYLISGLVPGRYIVEVQQSLPGYYKHGSVAVDAQKEGEFVIDASLCIEQLGYVYDASTSQRIEGAAVSLTDPGTGKLMQLPVYLDKSQLNPAATDASGNYAFFVQPGKYSISATAPGYIDFKSEITVSKDVVNINIPLRQITSIDFAKTADKTTATTDETITYTLSYKNASGIATNTAITDQVPENTSFVSASGGGAESKGTVRWNLGTLKPQDAGSVQLTVRVLSSAKDSSVIRNTAVIDSDETEPLSATAITTIQIPALSIQKYASSKVVEAGGNLEYTISYQNSGSGVALNVEIHDPIPERTSFVSATGNGRLQNGVVIWSPGTVSPGESGEVRLTVNIESPLQNGISIRNVAIIKSDQTPEMQAAASAEVRSSPILSLSKEADISQALPGSLITYTLRYKNTGNDTAADVMISDVLPEWLLYVEGGSFDESSRTVRWKPGDIKPDKQEQSIILKAKVKADLEPGLYEIQNTAKLTAAGADPIWSNPVFTSALVPYIQLTKMGNKRFVEIGDIITYMVTVKNLSSRSELLDVNVTDTLPRGFSYLKGTGIIEGGSRIDPIKSGSQIIFRIDQIPNGGSGTISYSTSVGSNAEMGDGINVAESYGYTPGTHIDKGYRLTSNKAEWQVQVRRGIFSDKGIIIGKVFIDDDGVQDKGELGVPNVRLIMEDGTNVITDEYGKYSVPEVDSGLHVLRVDELSLPADYVLTGRGVGYAGRPHTQFVRVESPAKADFMLRRVKKPIAVEVTTPTIIQPSAPIPVSVSEAVVTQPEIVLPISRPAELEPVIVPIEPATVIQPSPPVEEKPLTARTVEIFEVVVNQPVVPPEIVIRFAPERIPAGDPNITVSSDVPLKKVVATHPDGNQFALKPRGKEWNAHFLVPFDIPDGPYPILVTVTDMSDRDWHAVGLITIDNAVPCIYADCKPSVVEAGMTITIRVDSICLMNSVIARMDNGAVVKLRKIRAYQWIGSYTIPVGTRKGPHKIMIEASTGDEKHKFTETAVYQAR